jgi:hypothetical protein
LQRTDTARAVHGDTISSVIGFLRERPALIWILVALVVVVVVLGVVVVLKGGEVKVAGVRLRLWKSKPKEAEHSLSSTPSSPYPTPVTVPAAVTAPVPTQLSPAAAASLTRFLQLAHELYQVVENNARYRLEEVELTREMADDFTIAMTNRMRISAHEVPLFALPVFRASANVSCDNLADLKFSAKVTKGDSKAHWLPALDQPNEKRFLVIFFPPLMPGEAPQELTIRSEWPNVARKLQQPHVPDNNEYIVPGQAVAQVSKAILSLKLPNNGSQYKVSIRGPGTSVDCFIPDANGACECLHVFEGLRRGQKVTHVIERQS